MSNRIMIIGDDSGELQNSLSDIPQNFDFTFKKDIWEALFEKIKLSYKVIVFNITDPSLQSVKDLSRLKQVYSDTPFITIVSENTLELERQIRSIGIFFYIIKPYSLDDLHMLLNSAIQSRTDRY